MHTVRPIYRKLLIAAIAVFVIGISAMLSHLYAKVGKIEHTLLHLTGEH